MRKAGETREQGEDKETWRDRQTHGGGRTFHSEEFVPLWSLGVAAS